MKLRYHLTVLAVAVLGVSCAKQETPAPQDGGAGVLLRVSNASLTRTWLDSDAGGSPVSVWWSDGDRVNVNGQVSAPLEVPDGTKLGTAEFALRSVEAPFRVIYPAEAVRYASYSADGSIGISLPASQDWTEGSFAPGAAVLYGYAEDGNVALHNLMAAIRVRLSSASGAAIEKATLSSSTDPLCGDFRLSPENGSLTAENGSGTLSLRLAEAAGLTADGTDFYFTLPAGSYSEGLYFVFTDAAEHRSMERRWTPADGVEAGKLYLFDAIEFVPGAKDIETAAEWEEFALALNSGEPADKYLYSDGTVRIGADIEAERLTQIEDFGYILDGQGHTLTQNAATQPLFGSVSGTVLGLTLAGSLSGNSGRLAAVATYLNAGGRFADCTNAMSITAAQTTDSNPYNYAAGLVVHALGGSMVNCRNEGSITATADCTDGYVACQIGGIVCIVGDSGKAAEEDVTLKDCSNSGALTIVPTVPGSSTANLRFGAAAGTVAWVRDLGGSTLLLDNCDNSGAVTISGENITTELNTGGAGRASCVGGIIGIGAPMNTSGNNSLTVPSGSNGLKIEMKDCDNSGPLTSYAISRSGASAAISKSFIGGIAGALVGNSDAYISVTNCTSTGAIQPYDVVGGSEYAGLCSVDGGLVGWGGYLAIHGCTVKCSMGNGKRPTVAVAGAIGFAVKPFTVNGSGIYITGNWARLALYQTNRAIVAVVPVKAGTSNMSPVPDVAGSSVTDCKLGGSIRLSTNTVAQDNTGDVSDGLGGTYVDYFSTASQVNNNMVVGQGFTNNTGVTVSGNVFWNGK